MSINGGQKKVRRRRILFDRDPHCYWCGTEVIWFTGKHPPDNGATLDHLHSKLSGKRRQMTDQKEYTVLSCYFCNHDRGRREELKLPKEERRKRSQKHGNMK